MRSITKFLEYDLIHFGTYHLNVGSIIAIILIYIITKFILWFIKKMLLRRQLKHDLDRGNTYAIFHIIKYIFWVVAILLMLESVGLKITVLLAGSAALLVGVGLGLQQLFNDIISGIILLSEKSIKVDDILEIDGDIVKIQHIGLRTSTGANRDEVTIILPNSTITSNKVINWSHQSDKARFRITVGVAYGSKVDLVMNLLAESANEHLDISKDHPVEVRLIDFGNSSLDFELLFYSEQIFRIEKVKSDIRKSLNQKFNKNKISIPFPQMDVHMKNVSNS